MRCKACNKIMRVTFIKDENGERFNDLCGCCASYPAIHSSILSREYAFSDLEDEITQLFYELSKKTLDK